MPQLYPFLVVPIFDARPWGVRDLRPVYTRVVNEPIGESWLTWEDNRVANGPLAGQSIGDLARLHGRDLVGRLACDAERFPLLIKFLFPGDKLSVQVHPDDEGARKYGQPCGKTECWYVLRANPGAQVALGLKPGVTVEEFRKSIEETRAEELLNWVDVYAGDMLYVAAGTVHTIGGGMVLVETQQTSDITYRLYDYGRPRELHIEKGLEAVRVHTNAGKVIPADAESNVLVRSPFFQVERIQLHPELQTDMSPDSPHIVVAVSGAGILESPGMEPIGFAAGDAVVVPACVSEYTIRPQWEVDIMRMSLPAGPVPEPHTALPQSVSTGKI
jgi:mannose-6-phosphate isomerase